MGDDDLILRGSILERLDLAEHDAEERNWRSGANEIARLRKYVAALPAIVPQPAPRLPDLGAREAALREAAQCAIDNQDCSPWEVSEAILNLIGKKPAGPYPAEAEVSTLRDRLARMEGALRAVTQTLVWQCFGSCRGYSDNLLTPKEAEETARAALTDGGSNERG